MKKILFVEDDLMIIRIYRGKFQVEGYDVEVATDGQSALDSLRSAAPDLVLLDLQLPKVNGVEVLKFIRSQPALKNLPVIVFSNAFLGNLVEDAWKAGATKVLTKASCSPKQLLDVVRSAMTAAVPVAETAAPAPAPVASSAPAAAPSVASPLPQPAAFSGTGEAADATMRSVSPYRMIELLTDAKSQDIIRKIFLEASPHTLTTLRAQLLTMNRSEDQGMRQALLMEMSRTIHSLTGNAGLAGFRRIAQMASALEALVQELHDKPKNVNASSLRTLAAGVDALGAQFQSNEDPASDISSPAMALVVDDEAICRRAVCSALEKANLKSINLDDPNLALRVAAQNRFDLIFLDVEMPGMNGFDVAAKIREMPSNQHTPIVFVTTLGDFESRAKSMLSGGNDLIAKPFLLIELAVKALTYLLKPPAAAKPAAKAA